MSEDLAELEGENPTEKLPAVVEPIKTLQMVPTQTQDIEVALEIAEKHVKAQRRLFCIVLDSTNQTDWIDQAGNPYLQASGAKKIRRTVGCDICNVMYERVNYPDDPDGPYFVYEVVGDIKWNGQTVPETGSGSSRDAFFAKRKGKLLPMSEVDVQNIRKKALTNFWNRAIKSILGLSFTWEEIEDYTNGRVTRDKCAKVTYGGSKAYTKKKEKSSPATEKKRAEIKKMMGTMYGKKDAPNKLEQNTAFTTKEGKEVKGKRAVKDLTDKQINIIHPPLSVAYDKWKGENAVVSTNDPAGTPPKQPDEMPMNEMPPGEEDDLPF